MTSIDKLAEIRQKIRVLQAEADLIREHVILGDIPLEGEDYTAYVRRQVVLLAKATDQ